MGFRVESAPTQLQLVQNRDSSVYLLYWARQVYGVYENRRKMSELGFQ